ncbi:MAG: TIR domain-containing protein [Saccharothrix sp.]|nr:TIR domain-containing protein [Saccharothrix sp.]
MVDGSDPVRVFISYAHDSDDHVEHVRHLWMFLRRCGVDAKIDRVAAQRRQDWALWMGDQIRAADHVLVVASKAYREHAEGRSAPDVGRGVQWEARLIRDAFYRDQHALGRFVPVVLPGQSKEGVPDFFAPASSTVYTVRDYTPDGAEQLLRFLLRRPEEVEPPLGTAPTFELRDHGPTTPTSAGGGGAQVNQRATASGMSTVVQAGRDVFSYTNIQHFHGVHPPLFEQEPALTVRVDSIRSCSQGWFHAFRRDDAGAADQLARLGRLPGDVQDMDLLFRRQLAAGAYVLSDYGNPASVVLSLHNPTGLDVVLRDVVVSDKRDEPVVDGTAFLVEAGAWNEDPITFRLDAAYPLARLVEEGVDKGAYFDSRRVVIPAGGQAALPLRFDAVHAAHTFGLVLHGDWAGRSFSTTVDNEGQPFRLSPVIRHHAEEPNELAPAQPVLGYERAFDMAYDDGGPILVERHSGDSGSFPATR